jgi:PAS domain-containing protein
MEYGQGEHYRNDTFYKQIIKKSSNGFSYCRIIRNHCDIPIDYEYIEVNSAFEEFAGLKESDIIGKKGSVITQDLQDVIQKALVNGINNEVDIYLSYNKKWLRANINSINENNFICIYNDVSYEYSMKQEIKELFEINLDMICVTDTDFNLRNVNNEFTNVVGYTADELIGKNFLSN